MGQFKEGLKNIFGIRPFCKKFATVDKSQKGEMIREAVFKKGILILIVLLIIFTTIKSPSFLGLGNIVYLINYSASAIFLALGVAGIIVLTGTDLSAGRIMGFLAIICASLLQAVDTQNKFFEGLGNIPLILPLIIVMILGGLIGMFNGFFVAKFKLHSFIVTLATSLIMSTVTLWYLNLNGNAGNPIGGLNSNYNDIINGGIKLADGIFIRWYVLYAIIATLLVWFIWNKTKLGKNMFAVGSNTEAARVSGINVFWTIVMVFTMAGVLYGISAFIDSARVGSNSASTGVGNELLAIAACVIGGVSFMGGRGKISGVILGVFLLQIIKAALPVIIDGKYQDLVMGAVILIAVVIDMRKYIQKR